KALAANCLGISVEGLGKAPHPHEALTGLFAFAEGLTLAVLDGAQVELLVRSARYAGLKALPCAVFVTVDNPSLGGPAKELLDSISDTQTSESAPAFKGMRELTVPTFTSFVAFDTETTGLGNGDRLTEIGAVRVEDGRIVDRFQMLTDPGRHIPEDVAKLTGISDDMVAGQPDNKTVAAAFKEFAGDAVLVGHNIGFDLRMLASAAVPAGITFTNDYFDTNRLAQALKQTQGWEKTKLGYLTEKLGVELTHAHRALADAEATVGVYLKLRELAR
ncbi:MAG: 3'-5' exonuclease, partial [Eggerthellaceae bacterium]|nr:3'-5' exonuclease [Eggerthellaceae bacterium]